MLKKRSKIKKSNAYVLGGGYVAEWKIYVPRGSVNAAYFNIYCVEAETESFYKTNARPVVELQIVRNHLAKARGEEEWEVDWLYNGDNTDWVALGLTDPQEIVRSSTEKFIALAVRREEEFKAKQEEAKEKRKVTREARKKAEQEKLQQEATA